MGGSMSFKSSLARSCSCWLAGLDQTGVPVKFTLRLEPYLQEEFYEFDLWPGFIIEAAKFRSALSGAQVSDDDWERVEDEVCRVIYGSNLIEGSVTGLEYTVDLCRQIFHRQEVDFGNMGQSNYIGWLGDSKQRSRRKITQHAYALLWAIRSVLTGGPWTEELVKTIHWILCAGIVHSDVFPGQYRTGYPVPAKYVDPKTGQETVAKFISPDAVHDYMVAWVENLNRDIHWAKTGAPFDPYDMAAKYYHLFVNIQPFGDGNGQMSRIILNCLLLMLTGHLIPIGENNKEKEEFLGIAVRGAKKYHEDMEVPLDKQKGHREFARLVARKSVGPLEKMWTEVKKHVGLHTDAPDIVHSDECHRR